MELVVECGGVRANERTQRGGRRANRGDRIGTVYVSNIRPMETGGSIIDDIIWRRTDACKAPVPPKMMKEFIEKLFWERHFVKVRKVSYDIHAGCTCPCSPGYKVWGSIDHVARSEAKQDINDKNYLGSWCYQLSYFVTTPQGLKDSLARQEKEACRAAAFGGW